MRNIAIILVLLFASLVSGCGESKGARWLGGKREVPVTSPDETAPLSPHPVAKSRPSPQSLTPPPETDRSKRKSSPTLWEASPELKGSERVREDPPPLELTSLKYLGRRPPGGKRLKTLSEQIQPFPDRVSEKQSTRRRLILAPLADPAPLGASHEAQLPPEPSPTADVEPSDKDSTDALRAALTSSDKGPVTTAAADTPEEQADAEEKPPAAAPKPLPVPKPIVLGEEEVVAGTTLQVNDQHVSVDDILGGLHSELSKIPPHVSENDFRRMAEQIIVQKMQYQIEVILIMVEADRLLEERPKKMVEEDLENALRDMIAEAGNSQEQLKEKCILEGTTLEDVLKTHRRELTIQYYLRSKFYPAIVITRRMLWNHYRRHKDEFSTDKQVQMQIIAAPFKAFLKESATKPTAPELQAAKILAEELLTRALEELKAGKDFALVTRTHSRGIKAQEGGLWPMMGKGNKKEEKVEEVAFGLKEGQYSGIIEDREGCYIVKAVKVKPGKIVSFEDAQGEIADELKRQQYIRLQSDYMNKVFEKSTVSTPEGFIELAVDRAVQKYRR